MLEDIYLKELHVMLKNLDISKGVEAAKRVEKFYLFLLKEQERDTRDFYNGKFEE